MRSNDGSYGVKVIDRIFEVLLKGTVDGVLESAGASSDGDELATQNSHFGHVGVGASLKKANTKPNFVRN